MKQDTRKALMLPYFGLLILAFTLVFQLCYIMVPILSSVGEFQGTHMDEAPAFVPPSQMSAKHIIHNSFRETYVQLQDCSDEEKLASCMSAVSDNLDSTVPWWFKTVLRDGSDASRPHQLEGGWHYLASSSPSVRMCTIEKNGTTQWRKVFFSLNGADPPRLRPSEPVPVDAPAFVFFRDPLERFLSAYIDKCGTKAHRVQDKHCYPNIIFNNPESDVLHGLENDKKLLFATFVDTMPLDWNLHFFPQSLYCDGVFRHLDKYDYVGNMGPKFYHDLDRVGRRYGGRFELAVANVFNLRNKLNGSEMNTGVETAAPKHVQEYYTARTVKRVLEYLAVDYVLLHLPVPRWAENMLEDGS